MFVGSIDQGTTSSRFIIFNKKGEIVSVGQKEHEQIYPKAGWVEHNPEEIWTNLQEVIEKALKNANLTTKDLISVGITNQRETTLAWNKNTGKPYYNALVWQDTRVGDYVKEFEKNGGPDRFREKTGLPLATYFSGLKLRWLLKNVDGLREDAEKGEALFGTMDSYVAWHLTGGLHITDVTNASRTQLMDLKTCQWDQEILDIFEIPKKMLPEIKASSEIYGECQGILAGVPLAGILGDQQAALVGQTCFDAGQAKNTYGTGCFMLMNTGEQITPSKFGLLTTVAYQFGNEPVKYALEGSIAITGALVQWLRDNLGMIQSSAEIEELAKAVEDNGGCYFVPAFSGLYAPYWKTNARGVIAGLTRYVNKYHIARATLEASAFQTWEVIEAMEKDSDISIKSLRVDGGMVVNNLLMQFQSDILGEEVICPKIIETTALGAAYAAGLATGYWKDLEELKANWGIDKTWNPELEESKRTQYRSQWKKAVSKTFDWED